MDNQQERSRMDEDNISDANTDVTRSENRQGTGNANDGRNISNDAVNAGEGHDGSGETGSHHEGNYDKTSSKPMVDK